MGPTVVNDLYLSLSLSALLNGPWSEATVHPFINDVDPGRGAVVGDFDPATFGGSAAKEITAFGETYKTTDGRWEAVGPMMQWDWASGTTETIFGVYVLSSAGGTPLLGYARLDAGKEMSGTSSALVIVPRVSIGEEGFGAFLQVSE